MEVKRIALIGNPNSGKSSVFNQLTGLNQHVGNYPGITVEKKTGIFTTSSGEKIEVIDLPGTYGISPKSDDEKVVYNILSNHNNSNFPDLVIDIVDASNLERNLLLYSQVHDMKLPLILAVNMIDIAHSEGLQINFEKLSEVLNGVTVVPINARTGQGIAKLKEAIINFQSNGSHVPFLDDSIIYKATITGNTLANNGKSIDDTLKRYDKIKKLLSFCIRKSDNKKSQKLITEKLDRVLTHPVGGYGIFAIILFLMFQAIYVFAEIPMDLIDKVFFSLSQWIKVTLPSGLFVDLLAEGIVPGIGGVVIFVPQIALLFAFLAILEETGYMARVVFIMDKIMRPFGLNGKSVVPLMSGVACAIPAIMATRTIDQWKDRLVTIMVTPLVSCSARLPVYALLIALVVPDQLVWNFINLQGLALLGMYLLGFIAALLAAIVVKISLRIKERSYLILELPIYKVPRWNNVGFTIWEKTKIFLFDAGKVILAISIILWVLASFGPGNRMETAVNNLQKPNSDDPEVISEYNSQVSSTRLENSYIGILGKGIEPVIKPLGYNWQIGIALITSFAAREVFVGSMATIYSVGQDFEDDKSLLMRMSTEISPETGELVYNLASGFSLMVFYAFAMQCMSTLAIVRQETKSWKWPLVQLIYMTAMAYIGALITFNLLR